MDLITAANIPLFFESTKSIKQILQFLLQNKSNKANWTNWTPDARGYRTGKALQDAELAGQRADNIEGLEGRGDKPDSIQRNGQTNKQTKLCADAQRTQQRND